MAFVWLKQNRKSPTWFYGLGCWTRGNAEICLLAKRGKPKRHSAAVHQFIISPIEQHSKKPDVTRDKIVELAGDLPRVELFARQKCPGWDAWGNEVALTERRIQMAYVTVPKDLTHVKSKVVFGLTKRQLICFGGALLVGVPLYFLTRDYLSTSAAALLMVFIMLPGFLLAMYERHGQPLEVVVMQMIQCCFLRPKERPYQTNNAYAALMRQHQMEQEVKAIVQKRNSKRTRKNKADPRPAKRN